MSKYDADRALAIYKVFSKQTHYVVDYLAVARHYETATRLEVPKLKHAPTSLTSSLEEYLHDPDFEINRRQYTAQLEAKKGRGNANLSKVVPSKSAVGKDFPSPKASQATPVKQEPKGPAPDLIDFFDSIEQNQQPLAQPEARQQQQQQQQQQPLFQGQQLFQPQQGSQFQQQYPPQFAQTYSSPYNSTNDAPFNQTLPQPPVQQNSTGAGFGGYTPQQQGQAATSSQQSSLPTFVQGNTTSPYDNTSFQQPSSQQTGISNNGLQPQPTNPFRQSMMMQSTSSTPTQSFPGNVSIASPIDKQSTNPFARNLNSNPTATSQGTPFGVSEFSTSSMQSPSSTQQQQSVQPLTASVTGTNPFARNASQNPNQPQQQGTGTSNSGVIPNPTGTTNPFRQSLYQGQQSQGTMGGLDIHELPTMPVFPRAGEQQTGQNQQGWR
ncbi:MAG: hypothetical protein M1837_005979 [Sclerophora amabilis]|nr:MAG: hypothetical protein M1837_005979 [Sclerophora amabilis]